MTECERIIKEGILPESFFEEEVRCGFMVTKERKKIWGILLDLLMQLDSVCKKHGLTYYLTDGTLLGAIRHKGFIPWDDDIDVSLPREDYERLQTLGDEFRNPYFLQTPYSDSGYYYSFIKLRNSNTTGLSKAFRYQGFNGGLFLDIFPIDVVSIEEGKNVYERIRELCLGNSAYMKLSNPNYSKIDLDELREKASKDPLQACEEINRLSTQYNGSQGNWVSHWVSTMDRFEKKLWRREDFETVVYWSFEGKMFPVPTGYDRYLKTYFGDYSKLPPIEERGGRHNDVIFDPDRPYAYYVNNQKSVFPL